MTALPHSPLRTAAAAVLLTFGALGAVAAAAPAARASVSFGNDWAVATGSYSCSARSVEILPTSSEAVYGDYNTWSYAQVYDYDLGRWLTSPQWRRVDGITAHTFTVTRPYTFAVVHYARYVNGSWAYASEWVTLRNDLDNYTAFCTTPAW